MNFVDIQPESFLDYAWTSCSPTTPAPPTVLKPTKATRKQNRCCDQCRKGKRACDAAILEDTLLGEGNPSGVNPTSFHYSDVFGSLARCGNCRKTKKTCTFEWLRSQRVSQVAQRSDSSLPVKRRRTQSRSPPNQGDIIRPSECIEAPQGSASSGLPGQANLGSSSEQLDTPRVDTPKSFLNSITDILLDPFGVLTQSYAEVATACCTDEGARTDVEHSDSGFQNSPSGSSVSLSEDSNNPRDESNAMRLSRKRKCSRSPSSREMLYPSFSNDLVSSTNNTLLTESLLRAYRDSFEHHLSCWLTEKTCPVKNFEGWPLKDSRPGWDSVYHQVFRLDRLSFVRGRTLSATEDKAASKALNMAVVAFASQRAQCNDANGAKYPFQNVGDEANAVEQPSTSLKFDKSLQISAWHQARIALAEAEGIESFRVALALIVFSLTQRPVEDRDEDVVQDIDTNKPSPYLQQEGQFGPAPETSLTQQEDPDVNSCKDMLSKLSIVIDEDGPPINLEKGLRLLHSLRSRMVMAGTLSRPKKTPSGKKGQLQAKQLDVADTLTVDLLFWLALMFDTLSSAIYRRPLVIALEDSDLPITGDNTTAQSSYDDYLFSHQRFKPIRWPCSNAVASSVICEAAPIKVLLFRKVTRIQSLLSRGIRGRKIEEAIQAALEVCGHWQTSYTPFFSDVFDVRNRLPVHLRSWSICVTGHYHLAALLLADLIEIADNAEATVASQRCKRKTSGFISAFRRSNCMSLSDMAKCACAREDELLASEDDNSARALKTLLSEPWTVVLIRAFATAGVYLMDSATNANDGGDEQEEAFRRADDCICALWCLGRKSNMAMMAAKMLGEALKQGRTAKGERNLNSFVELWGNLDQIDEFLGVHCV